MCCASLRVKTSQYETLNTVLDAYEKEEEEEGKEIRHVHDLPAPPMKL